MYDLKALEQNYQSGGATAAPLRQSLAKPEPKQEVGGLQRFLAEAAPIVGGTLGAIGGSFLAPGIGTAGGGAAGAGIGSAIRSSLLGEQATPESILGDAAFGALPGAGKLLKGGLGAVKVAGKGEDVIKGFKAANATSAATSGVAKPSMIQRASSNAVNADKKASGFQVGQSLNRKTLTPDQSSELYDFARVGSKKYVDTGIRAGKPIQQAGDAQKVLNGVLGEKKRLLGTIDRPLAQSETRALVEDVTKRLDSSGIVGMDKTVAAKIRQIKSQGSVAKLEDLRQKLDDIAYTAAGAGKTNTATVARLAREAIDDFVSPMSAEYKAVKGDYRLAKDALELVSKGSKNARGINIFGNNVLPESITGARSKGADVLRNLTGGGKVADQEALSYAFRPSNLIKKGVGQAVSQGVGNALTAPPPNDTTVTPDATAADTSLTPGGTDLAATDATPGSMWSDRQAVQAAYTKALLAGDQKAADSILKGFQAFGQAAAPIKKTESQRARDEAAALTQKALGQLNGGKVQTGPIASPIEDFKSIFNAGDQPTIDFNVTVNSLKAAIAKARAGTSFTPNEEALLNRYAPTSGDSQQQLQTKLTNLMQVYQGADARERGTQYSEPTAAAELGIQ